MKRILFLSIVLFTYHLTIYAQAVYVDNTIGDDKNPGTKALPVYSIQKAAEIIGSRDNDIYVMKINPGIYILDNHVSIATEKAMSNKRVVLEASILPDDSAWTPEKMPVIDSKAKKGEIPESNHFVVSFLINESRVTVR